MWVGKGVVLHILVSFLDSADRWFSVTYLDFISLRQNGVTLVKSFNQYKWLRLDTRSNDKELLVKGNRMCQGKEGLGLT